MTVLALLAAAAAASNASAAPVSQEPIKAVEDRVVCKSERFVGSHRTQRICKPKSEWDTARKDAKEAMERMRLVNPPEKGPN